MFLTMSFPQCLPSTSLHSVPKDLLILKSSMTESSTVGPSVLDSFHPV